MSTQWAQRRNIKIIPKIWLKITLQLFRRWLANADVFTAVASPPKLNFVDVSFGARREKRQPEIRLRWQTISTQVVPQTGQYRLVLWVVIVWRCLNDGHMVFQQEERRTHEYTCQVSTCRLLPHIMAKNMLPFDVLVFGMMNLVVMLIVHMVHLVYQVLSIRHEFTHGIWHKVRVQAVRPVVTPLIWYK